ncbi:MAG: hypothetical protein MRERC_4c069 [Mycoplasmataceae bacterium RC_NB112A]|nr:MAG: hypothetical protein MRERC_4c069 [Mycoplasmataceae bacterium RC_NB112A]
MDWTTIHLLLAVLISLTIGAIAGFLFARWFFGKQLQEIEKNYQNSVRKSYQEMGNLFGRKMKEEDLNRITNQLEERNKSEKTSPKKTKTNKKRKK